MHDWYKTALGQAISDAEFEATARLLPPGFYQLCVQIEGPAQLDYFRNAKYRVYCRVSLQYAGHIENTVIGVGEWLPFGENSVDLMILPHVLEFSDHPHDVLREVSTCVCPSGLVLIIGFNPNSMLNLMRRLNQFDKVMPDGVIFHPVQRIRDWLRLLGFEVCAGEFVFFRPPFRRVDRLNQMVRLETAGARWWPAMGSVYILLARKLEMGIRTKFDFKREKFGSRKLELDFQ